jgi:hypothetical protein
MSELNDSQRKIATTLDGMIVVDAGPGTGKTSTIIEIHQSSQCASGSEGYHSAHFHPQRGIRDGR